jgi:hypothetical protein
LCKDRFARIHQPSAAAKVAHASAGLVLISNRLRIKNFYGTSENALRTQIWIAISIYVLVAIVKKELHLEASLYRMLQICSVTLFEKTPVSQALSLADDQTDLDHLCKQLILFN